MRSKMLQSTLKMPSGYTVLGQAEQSRVGGGSGYLSYSIFAVAKFIFPEKKIAGESRGGYYPTFILVPEAVFFDYAALRVSGLLYKAAVWVDKIGL